ncbi:CoA pyrophosphatase [Fusibacter paucivorans]|uniref:CoA pyrophosphatase n=1 Tax=Fusibacter paucivorans TaxID=76009 RepID=A0ABS5PMX0_9FIRM|nr:CoA pyrophosphatase [Fusibacter paucivorans]MBS7525711.1 CoA pyrophosphatase [Fusibacter paucivorans]
MNSKIIETLKQHKANITGVKRESAVLIPLVLKNGVWHLMYEVRAATLKSQPGEICFPGGKLECHEDSESAAIRETCEELNLEPSDIEVIGRVDSILTSFNMLIHCFVGIIDKPFESIHFSKDEVDHVFLVPVPHLCENAPDTYEIQTQMNIPESFPFEKIPDGKDYDFRTSKYPVIFYHYKDKHIWGLTARMTRNFVELLSPHCDHFDQRRKQMHQKPL